MVVSKGLKEGEAKPSGSCLWTVICPVQGGRTRWSTAHMAKYLDMGRELESAGGWTRHLLYCRESPRKQSAKYAVRNLGFHIGGQILTVT